MQKTNSSTLLLLFFAILFGLLAVYAVRRLNSRAPVAVAGPTAPSKLTIPLASRDLPVGRVVSLSDVALVSMSREQMKSQGINGMFMSDPKQVIGSTVKLEVKQGKPFHTEQFYPEGYRPDVADRLEPGKRAVTILVGSDDALSGYAYAGQYVDLIFRLGDANLQSIDASKIGVDKNGNRTWDPKLGYHAVSQGGNWKYTYDDRTGRTTGGSAKSGNGTPYAATTVTLLQGVEILALENNTVQDSARRLPRDGNVRVTIAVTPDQAATLRAVEGRGVLSLALRNPEDDQIVENVKAKTLDEILGKKPIEEAPPGPVQRRTERMEVYRGSSMRQLEFDGSHPLAVRIDPTFFKKRAVVKQEVANETANEVATLNQPNDVSLEQSEASEDAVEVADVSRGDLPPPPTEAAAASHR